MSTPDPKTVKVSKKSENKCRRQFSKIERMRFLSIVTEYSQDLGVKNISVVRRNEIWSTIERKFNESGGHLRRTMAQLKKYWQNYKYYSKRTRALGKSGPISSINVPSNDSTTSHKDKTLSPYSSTDEKSLLLKHPVVAREWEEYDPNDRWNARLINQLTLRDLEIEEKRLKVQLAEMTLQEIQLRIQLLEAEGQCFGEPKAPTTIAR